MYCSDGEAELSAICLKKKFIHFVGQFLFCFVLVFFAQGFRFGPVVDALHGAESHSAC